MTDDLKRRHHIETSNLKTRQFIQKQDRKLKTKTDNLKTRHHIETCNLKTRQLT